MEDSTIIDARLSISNANVHIFKPEQRPNEEHITIHMRYSSGGIVTHYIPTRMISRFAKNGDCECIFLTDGMQVGPFCNRTMLQGSVAPFEHD